MNSEQPNVTTHKNTIPEDYRKLHIRPWVRFFARLVDFNIYALTLVAIIYIYDIEVINPITYRIILLVFFLLFELFILWIFGTTIGKYLLRIQLTDLKGNNLNFVDALVRTFLVLFLGMALLIPVISLVALCISYFYLKKTGTTYWDKNKFIIVHKNVGYSRYSIALLIITLGLGINIFERYNELHKEVYDHKLQSNYNEVENLNKNLPQMIDDETELFRIELSDNILTYHYRLVKHLSSDFNKDLLYESLRNHILKTACNSKQTNKILTSGITLSYRYVDKNGVPIIDILIKNRDCNNQ